MRGQKRVLKGVHARLRRAMDARERAFDPRIHLLRKKSLRRRMDCIATRACPSCAVLCAASRASPTCGVKPGNDSEGVVPAKAGTHNHRQWLWVPALAALGRDDDCLVRAKHQLAAV